MLFLNYQICYRTLIINDLGIDHQYFLAFLKNQNNLGDAMNILLQKVNQGPTGSIFAGKMTVKQLISSYKIDVYDPKSNPTGYQRTLDEKRARKFATFLRTELEAGKTPIIPTAILLSYRKNITGTPTASGIDAIFPNGDPLYVVDGQHRTNGYRIAIEEYGLHDLLNYEVPVVIFENADLKDEIRQFLLINNTIKKVKTDLARDLYNRLDRDGSHSLPVEMTDEVKAHNIARFVTENKFSPWKGKLSGPNEKGPEFWNTQMSFANSIKTLINSDSVKRMPADQFAKELVKFWAAVEKLMPKSFTEAKSYLITKNNGFVALNRVFTRVYSHLKYSKNNPDPSIEDYRKILEEAGEFMETEFWERGNEDGASGFGGGYGGFTNLAEAICDELQNNGIDF